MLRHSPPTLEFKELTQTVMLKLFWNCLGSMLVDYKLGFFFFEQFCWFWQQKAQAGVGSMWPKSAWQIPKWKVSRCIVASWRVASSLVGLECEAWPWARFADQYMVRSLFCFSWEVENVSWRWLSSANAQALGWFRRMILQSNVIECWFRNWSAWPWCTDSLSHKLFCGRGHSNCLCLHASFVNVELRFGAGFQLTQFASREYVRYCVHMSNWVKLSPVRGGETNGWLANCWVG